jgi:nuclear pore complex protein Nup155
LFIKAAANIQVSRLQETSKRYRSLQYTAGAIELPLKVAAELDPNDRAIDYVRDGRHPADKRKEYYEQRSACYECVIEALDMFDAALDKAVNDGNGASC